MRGKKRVRNVSSELRQSARALRGSATEAEQLLWAELRDGRLDGWKFRRQHAIGRFVLDFYCSRARLVVEVDGSSHEGREERDAARSGELEAHGLRVLRFQNEAVLDTLPAVLGRIRLALGSVPPLPELGEGARG